MLELFFKHMDYIGIQSGREHDHTKFHMIKIES